MWKSPETAGVVLFSVFTIKLFDENAMDKNFGKTSGDPFYHTIQSCETKTFFFDTLRRAFLISSNAHSRPNGCDKHRHLNGS